MKKISTIILGIFFLGNTHVFSQTTSNSITGVVTDVKPKFLGNQSLTVDKTELVLIASQSDTTNSTFEINKELKDILVKKDGAFMLNPKYANKTFKFTYSVNGKGWKCISNAIEEKHKSIKKILKTKK